jgi:hypothetical protein
VDFLPIEPYRAMQIDAYQVLAVPVNHCEEAVGYQISVNGRTLFYTSDTGPGLSRCFEDISPHLLVVDVTMPDAHAEFARATDHLTPAFLQEELLRFREIKGYLPEVVAVHMNPWLEEDIARDAARVASALSASITLAREGMELAV